MVGATNRGIRHTGLWRQNWIQMQIQRKSDGQCGGLGGVGPWHETTDPNGSSSRERELERTPAATQSKMSIVTPSHLEAKLRAELGASFVEASDLSDGCGQKFSLIVVHDGFDGQSLLERQRSVNECLKEEMTRIHALQMKTWTSAQYQQKMQKAPPAASSPTSQPAGEN